MTFQPSFLESTRGDLGRDHHVALGIDPVERLCGWQGNRSCEWLGGVRQYEGPDPLVAHRPTPGPTPTPRPIVLEIFEDVTEIELALGYQLHHGASGW